MRDRQQTDTAPTAMLEQHLDLSRVGRFSRRTLLMRTGALGCSTAALAALIACGGQSKPTATVMPTMTHAPATTSAASGSATTPKTGADAAVTGGMQIGIANFNFSPKSLIVPVGAMVTWTNHDDVPHTVTSRDKKFTSQAIDTDERFSFTFTEAGTYAYFCAIHPIMTAEIVVK